MFNLDDWEKKLVWWIGIAIGCFFFSLAWVILAHAETIGNYSNGSQAIRGECEKELYYLTWTEQVQESYYTRSNYYAVTWNDPLILLENNKLNGHLKYYEWKYNSQDLKVTEVNEIDLGVLNGKIDIFSNASILSYPQSNNINSPITQINEMWIHIFIICGVMYWGIRWIMHIINGSS